MQNGDSGVTLTSNGSEIRQENRATTKTSIRPAAASPKKVGRPRAKHSDPNYTQMSIYIQKDVRTRVKMRLFESGGEFSGLVESLLRDWLKAK